MESKTQKAIGMKYEPVAIMFSNEREEGAKQFKEGKWGCVMWLLTAAARGGTSVLDRKTFGCFGGGTGMGFGNQYLNFPGGEECFCYFLSTGNEKWDQGRQAADQVKQFMRDEAYEDFVHGEGYLKTPELVKKFIGCLPITDVPAEYVVMKPLKNVAPGEKVEVVVFLVDPDQLSALTVLVNYGRGTNDNVIVPYAAGCMSIGIYPFAESRSARPRAVMGLVDLSARVSVKRQLGEDLFTMAVAFSLFQEMEEGVEGSFLQRHTWKVLRGLAEK